MRRRHIRADHDEWVVVHRDPPPDPGSGCGCLIALVILFGYFPSLMNGYLGVIGLILLIGLITSWFPRG